jgi:3-(3-hydroxy-phenyl)propionate hydroxylase
MGVLESYNFERHKHASAMVSFATRIGRMYSQRSRFTEVMRDSVFRAINGIPSARDYILQMKYKPMPNYVGGLVVPTTVRGSPVGRMAGQPFVETPEGRRVRLDDTLGVWFAVVGIHHDPLEHLSQEARSTWEDLGARFVTIEIARDFPIEFRDAPLSQNDPSSACVRLVDIDGVFEEMALARPTEEILILRPDRYVMAACPARSLEEVTRTIGHMLRAEAALKVITASS